MTDSTAKGGTTTRSNKSALAIVVCANWTLLLRNFGLFVRDKVTLRSGSAVPVSFGKIRGRIGVVHGLVATLRKIRPAG
jgi:hypothetical protein